MTADLKHLIVGTFSYQEPSWAYDCGADAGNFYCFHAACEPHVSGYAMADTVLAEPMPTAGFKGDLSELSSVQVPTRRVLREVNTFDKLPPLPPAVRAVDSATGVQADSASGVPSASGDWEFLEQVLQPCVSQLRKSFDKDAYRLYMEPHGPHTSSTVARTQAIASMVDEVVGTISGAMPSERARDLVEQNVFQVRRLLKREV